MCGWVGGVEDAEEEEEEGKVQQQMLLGCPRKNAATVHKMDHYPSIVYHYVVDKSMALSAMTPCYSKHKALRLSPCLL